MIKIKNTILKKIYWFVLAASLLALAISNYLVYPSFTNMLVANTEAEAVMVGRHISRMIFPLDLQGDVELTPQGLVEINHALNEFNFYKLKVFTPSGEAIYSTDSEDIGAINTNEYFRNVVAHGYVHSKMVKKNARSMEGQEIKADVIETYIPIIRNGSFAGALEIYLDITEKISVLRSTLIICNVLSIGFIGLFSMIVLTTLIQLDKTIDERERTFINLEKTNTQLNKEVEVRKHIQSEKENLIDELQSSLMKVKLLSGFLPICSCCKKIRDDNGYWNQIESYIRDHSEAEFSHGMCPGCMKEYYPEFNTTDLKN